MRLLANHGWAPKPPKAPDLIEADQLLRLLIVDAVNAGKLGKADLAEANRLIGGRPLAVYAKLAREFAEQCAETSDVQASELLELISKGPAAALFKLVCDRKAAWETFQLTAYSQKVRDLTAARDTASSAFAAVENDEDTTPQKKRRLYAEYEASLAALSVAVNSNDPELVAYRREAKKTADPSMNELKWESFAI